jgi:hypothetical protein
MDKKQSPKMAALLELRKMVEELINDDFKSSKMPKLMALKVKMTPEVQGEPESPMEDIGEEQPEEHSLSNMIKSASQSPDSKLGTEPCAECGEMDCECDGMEKPEVKAIEVKTASVESPGVAKLKKLLGK